MNNSLELSLDSEVFNAFKSDFKQLLNSTLNTMQQKEVETATISAKFEINLITDGNPNLSNPESTDEREVTIPMFKHKVTASMQFKSEKSGFVGSPDLELVWDKSKCAFALVPISNNQASMFDDGYDYDDFSEEDFNEQ